MVKIRKKTSSRQSTRIKHKVEHKVAEHRRKQKKAAKKDPTWRSKQKDPGVPNILPFKNAIVEEVQAARQQREETKEARKEMLSLSQLAMDAQDTAEVEDTEDMGAGEEVESNLKAHARSLKSVISTADILVQVLDARDPLGTRTLQLEKEILQALPAKKLVFVLNKVDLVPKENVAKWLEYLRRSFPTLPFKSSTQLQRAHLSSSDSSASALLQLLKGYARGSAKSLTVGVIGLPNVGKSSLINTLKRKKACPVAPLPGWTKDVQAIVLDGGLKILDCPGVVLASGAEQSQAHQVLKGTLSIDQLEDTITPVELLLSKCKKEHLMLLYNIPNFDTVQQFLTHVARSKGRLKKGGLPDVAGTARTVIRDWTAGRIPYFTIPPAMPAFAATDEASSSKSVMADNKASDEILSGFSAEFDLDALFESADKAAFKEASGLKGVAMAGSLQDGPQDGEVKLIGEEDETMESEPAVVTSKKRKDAPDTGTTAIAPPKKVSFAQDKKSTMFTPAEQEELDQAVGQNKAIAKAAKKAKKRQAKQSVASNDMDTAEDGPAKTAQEDEADYLGFEARAAKALSLGGQIENADGEAYDFNAFFGVGSKGKLKLDQTA